jgi:hypothetical protein
MKPGIEALTDGGVASGRAPRERQGRLPTPPRYEGQLTARCVGCTTVPQVWKPAIQQTGKERTRGPGAGVAAGRQPLAGVGRAPEPAGRRDDALPCRCAK